MRIFITRMILFAGLVLCSVIVSAQEEAFFNSIEADYNPGFIMPHNSSIDYITRDYTKGFNISLVKQSNGSKLWQQVYHYPRIGYGFYHGTLGNDKVFGKTYSLYSFFDAPIFHINKFFALNYRLSYGISYITKPFHVQNNYNNIAIGSHLNIHFNLMLNSTISIDDRNHLVAGLGFSHFSNGKTKSPNKGLNIVSGTIGFRHLFTPAINYKERPDEIPDIDNKNLFSVIWAHGYKAYSVNKNRFDYISSLCLNYERRYAQWGKYGGGVDLFYNHLIKDPTRIDAELPRQFFRAGVHLSHDFIVGDFSLLVQLGHYIYNNTFEEISLFYNRVGLRYYLNDNWLINLSLKSKKANAQFVEAGMGFIL